MLTNFPAKKIYNSGGYKAFSFIPYNQVISFPMISAGAAVVAVSVSGSPGWCQGYATAETLSLTEEAQNDGNGVYYNVTVSGFVPGDRAALIDLISQMEIYRHVLIVKDISGLKRLVGSPATPLDFTASFGSGTSRTDQKGFSFEFKGQSLYRAPLYNW